MIPIQNLNCPKHAKNDARRSGIGLWNLDQILSGSLCKQTDIVSGKIVLVWKIKLIFYCVAVSYFHKMFVLKKLCFGK